VRTLTENAIAALDEGRVPVLAVTARPNDPTPIYWRTVMVTGVQPGQDTPSVAVQRHLGVARAPIPQRPLSYQAKARSTDPATSHQAAASVNTDSHNHGRILGLLKTFRDGLTDEQLRDEWAIAANRVMGWPPISDSGLRSRRSELVRAGKVVDSGEKGRTAAGRACTIWKLADG
jgi:hypothetical protein